MKFYFRYNELRDINARDINPRDISVIIYKKFDGRDRPPQTCIVRLLLLL